MGDLMPTEQAEFIDELQRWFHESTNMSHEDCYRFAFVIWQHKVKLSQMFGYEQGRADAIDEVPKWHLCGEDLPSVSDVYIVACIKGEDLICTSFATFQSKYKKWNLTGARAYWKVIAWMEMPKFKRYDKGAEQ